ncbi:M14 family metallopeptidase [Acetanaerobacterium elongatum]|uniref:G-D-glutamyl-meso-diaminopimelate peptidase n=1 Tax=Acetanaerobacterium elongatum TaxID=258515 RepID=A0A1G9UKA7_9FIRM|nr:M14 family metallocarboxypeptidase [Acetanaerobacterium elongatum]SDM60361.1 g-D-glutamyl-meso-diaminopimelate peptidase [Acetanaerobacterium elongatum]
METYSRFYGIPPEFYTLTKRLAAIAGECIQAELFSAGKSVLGRDLWAISFGERRNAVLFAGGFHAQEWITVLLLTRFLEDYAYTVYRHPQNIHSRRENKPPGLIVLPCVNPDGLELVVNGFESAGLYKKTAKSISGGDLTGWNANVRGVDINHNFNASFELVKAAEQENGITGPAKRQYGGEYPESEPETRALCLLCRMYLPSRVVAFHSQGEEIYYSYGNNTPASAYKTAQQLAKLSGYALREPTGMASHGGFKDWYINRFGREGFTIEIGKGVNPLPVTDLPDIYSRLSDMLFWMVKGETIENRAESC